MKSIVILYHANCPDGFRRQATWKKFGNKAEYIPVNPETLPEKPLKNKIVYTLDMSFKAPVFRRLMKQNKSIVSLDHHKSRKEDMENSRRTSLITTIPERRLPGDISILERKPRFSSNILRITTYGAFVFHMRKN